MNRYRTVGENDDTSMMEGDTSFSGVDQYNAIENIEPGLVQDAVNIDFSSQDAMTRGGFVSIPALGTLPFGSWVSQASATDLDWAGVAYGNGVFAAVGDGATTMWSPDGSTWVSASAAMANSWSDVTFGAAKFVAVATAAVSSSNVMTSVDGVTWTLRASPDQSWEAVCYGGGQFVAVASTGASGRVMTSANGTSWTAQTTSTALQLYGVAYGNGVYVAVGQGVGTPILVSSDGVTWAAATGYGSITGTWNNITFAAGKFVVVGTASQAAVMTSTDGQNWTQRVTPTSNEWVSVTYGSGIFAAVSVTGSDDRVMTSPDGVVWTKRKSPVDNDWRSVAHGGPELGTFVAVSDTGSGNRVMSRPGTNDVFAHGRYSDPNEQGSDWIVLVGATSLGFYAFGRTGRIINYDSGLTVTQQATVVQCNNSIYIFRGSDERPLYWDGVWGNEVTLAPTITPSNGFSSIPSSDQATFAQNRLWVKNGKDTVSASDVLDFDQYDDISNSFNLNTGDSDYVVTTYPFGSKTLLVFKNKSILALENIDGSLSDIAVTEITRQVGAIGINSVVSVGSDVVYMSDRNINLISLTNTNNALQHQTLPLSTKIKKVIDRVNWQYAYKVSMAYHDNKLFVALPLDNAIACNTVAVYNFITGQWFGEWSFNASLGIKIQGWVVANYLGIARLHAITEDGRVFVVGEGQNDISGTNVCEISTSITTRAYVMDNGNRINRRLYLDLATNRPSFSVVAYSEGAAESSTVLTNQTYSRSQSWRFNDSTYTLTNANDDYNRAYRKDYSTGPNSIQPRSGFLPEMEQEYRFPIITRRQGRLTWLKLTNTQGLLRLMSAGFEARPGSRSNLVQV